MSGQIINTIAADQLNVGEHVFNWDGTNNKGGRSAAGVYYCRLMTETGIAVQKLVKF